MIDGARRAIATGGWQAATLTRIAEEAGVSRMTLHRRGLGRDEIFALLARDYEEAFRAALWPTVTGKGTGAERLEAMLVAVCEVTEDHLDFLAALDEEADRRFFHESDDEVHSREGYITPIERLLADGIADGSLREVEIEETATVLVNATDRTYRHLRRAHDWDPERSRGALIDLVLRGLLAGLEASARAALRRRRPRSSPGRARAPAPPPRGRLRPPPLPLRASRSIAVPLKPSSASRAARRPTGSKRSKNSSRIPAGT